MKKKLGIFIPTFERLAHNLDILSFYERLGYFNCNDIDVHIIENPSEFNTCPSRLPSQVKYFLNTTQIGLHGSWHRVVTTLGIKYEWLYMIGDTDYLTIPAVRLLELLSECALHDTSVFIFDNMPLRFQSSFMKNVLTNNTPVMPVHFRARTFFNHTSLDNGFSYISSTIFRSTDSIRKYAEMHYSNKNFSDCLHFLTLYTFALDHNSVISLLPRCSSPYVSNFISSKYLSVFGKYSILSPGQVKYLKSFSIKPLFFNLYMWILVHQDLNSYYSQKHKTQATHYDLLMRKSILRSYLYWFSKSRSFGFGALTKLILSSVYSSQSRSIVIFIIDSLAMITFFRIKDTL